METTTYINIFETKGIEYIIVIGFFAVLIPFWMVLNRQIKYNRLVNKTSGIFSAKHLRIPMGLFFSRYHTWAFLDRSGRANVGTDDFLFHITGPVKFTPLKKKGEKVEKGETLAEIEHAGKFLQIKSPVSGEVLEANEELIERSDLLSIDPYRKGWMYKIHPSDWLTDIRSCFLGNKASEWVSGEVDRFRGFLSTSASEYNPGLQGVVLQDGGEMISQPLSDLPEEVWNDFQQQFLG